MPTALIVEDEPQANKLLCMLIQLRGYRTESAYEGLEALDQVRHRVPDVVFLDLMLPDVDGYQVCRSLKSSGSTCLVPVIIVTARIAAENRIESFGVGADDYIPKPYTPDEIFLALDRSNSWKAQMDESRVEGLVALDDRDDGDTLRNLARLRNHMLARSGLGPEATKPITAAIKAIWSSVDSWSRRSSTAQMATLSFELTSECLTLIVRDQGGWLRRLDDIAEEQTSQCLTEAQFDQIITDDANHSLKLVKHFKTG
jgi:CheY-like chemotaxis protein